MKNMKLKICTFMALGLLLSSQVYAEKPEWAGQGKQAQEQTKAFGDSMIHGVNEEKEGVKKKATKEYGIIDDKMKKAKKGSAEKVNQGLEKQREKKQEKIRKEIDKGSEQGQAAREEHSKKWWKFWE